MNKKTVWLIIILIVLVIVAAGYFYKIWWPKRQAIISLGLANPNFPWRAYSQDELNKLYPQIRYADVPTRVTPEQTYAQFREALRTNDLEMALGQLSKSSDTRYKEREAILRKAYQDNKFSALFDSYPEKIEQESMYESIAQFYFLQKEQGYNLRQYINFSKDSNGDWKMDSL